MLKDFIPKEVMPGKNQELVQANFVLGEESDPRCLQPTNYRPKQSNKTENKGVQTGK